MFSLNIHNTQDHSCRQQQSEPFFGWDGVLNLTKSNKRGVPLGELVHISSEITSNLLLH